MVQKECRRREVTEGSSAKGTSREGQALQKNCASSRAARSIFMILCYWSLTSVLCRCWLGGSKGIRRVKN